MSIFLKMLLCSQMWKIDQQPEISVMMKLGRKVLFFFLLGSIFFLELGALLLDPFKWNPLV